MKIILFTVLVSVLLSLGVLVAPQVGLAQTPSQADECAELREQIKRYGGETAATKLPAYCDPVSIYSKIVGFMHYIIGIVAVISLIYAGYLYMTARDNEAQLKKAKFTLIWTIVGIVVAVLATLIVGAVINLIVDNKVF